MRFLVTGAAGFLGFCMAKSIAADPSNSVICVDNFSRGEHDDAYGSLAARSNVTALELDLNEQAAVRSLPLDVDVIYHLAALNGTQNFYERPFEVVRSCTLPTIFLIEHYGPAQRLKRFVYAGTSEAYASTVTRFGWPVPTAEDVPLGVDDVFNARWSYGGSKMHGEIATINGCRNFATPFSIARFHNAYGPRMGDKHVIPDFLMRARRGVYALYGHEDTRAFIYSDDAVRATRLVGETDACAGEIINVGGLREMNMLELARMMMEIGDMKGEIALHPAPKGSVRRRAPNTEKLRRLTGFTESWSLRDGLAETIKYYMA